MSSLVIFSVTPSRLANFYEAILDARPLIESSGDIRLVSEHDEVLIHSIPEAIARDIEISTPPVPRDGMPIKPVFDVDSLQPALDAVRAMGGALTDHTFTFDGQVRHDVLDPEGNVIQIRSRTS